MDLRLITQPFYGQGDVVEFVSSAVEDPDITHLDIVVAWAKRSGFKQVLPTLRRFRGRGGRIRMIVGISQGGATQQGLELTLRESDEPYVFHDPSGRTFHPKLYHASGPNGSYTLIGSQNLTRGGVIENFEIGVQVHANRHDDADQLFFEAVEASIGDMIAEAELCLPLTAELLERLCASPEFMIGNEDTSRPPRAGEPDESLAEPSPATSRGRIFGRSASRFSRAPITRSTDKSAAVPPSDEPSLETPPLGSDSQRATVVRRWFKQMKAADAQRLPGTSNPSGHLTLTKAGHPIQFSTYFREDFFVDCTWVESPGSRGREMCAVSFSVEIDGDRNGIHTLHVDHNPSFASNQRNRVTTLRWGDVLSHHMRHEADHTDDYVTLEALSDGSFRLVVSDAPIGEFIY